MSIAPLLRGETTPERTIFWHYPHYGNQGGAPAAAIRQGDWKLIHWYDPDRVELYNTREDLSEKNNLADRYPARVKDLSSKLEAWQKQTGARLPTSNPAWHER